MFHITVQYGSLSSGDISLKLCIRIYNGSNLHFMSKPNRCSSRPTKGLILCQTYGDFINGAHMRTLNQSKCKVTMHMQCLGWKVIRKQPQGLNSCFDCSVSMSLCNVFSQLSMSLIVIELRVDAILLILDWSRLDTWQQID